MGGRPRYTVRMPIGYVKTGPRRAVRQVDSPRKVASPRKTSPLVPLVVVADPEDSRVTVLTLSGESYTEHGAFESSETATSRLLAGFAIDVDELFSVK